MNWRKSTLTERSGTSSSPSALTSRAWVRSSTRSSLPEAVTDMTNLTVTTAPACLAVNER